MPYASDPNTPKIRASPGLFQTDRMKRLPDSGMVRFDRYGRFDRSDRFDLTDWIDRSEGFMRDCHGGCRSFMSWFEPDLMKPVVLVALFAPYAAHGWPHGWPHGPGHGLSPVLRTLQGPDLRRTVRRLRRLRSGTAFDRCAVLRTMRPAAVHPGDLLSSLHGPHILFRRRVFRVRIQPVPASGSRPPAQVPEPPRDRQVPGIPAGKKG